MRIFVDDATMMLAFHATHSMTRVEVFLDKIEQRRKNAWYRQWWSSQFMCGSLLFEMFYKCFTATLYAFLCILIIPLRFLVCLLQTHSAFYGFVFVSFLKCSIYFWQWWWVINQHRNMIVKAKFCTVLFTKCFYALLFISFVFIVYLAVRPSTHSISSTNFFQNCRADPKFLCCSINGQMKELCQVWHLQFPSSLSLHM